MSKRDPKSLGMIHDPWDEYHHSIIPLGRNCAICDKPILITTKSTYKERAGRKFCSKTCLKTAQRIKFDFLPIKKKDSYDNES